MNDKKTKVLVVASFGGHWNQLWILKKSFEDHELSILSTSTEVSNVSGAPLKILKDCSKSNPIACLICLFQALIYVKKIYPDIVITTGAAPGLMSIVAAKILGINSIWIDSIANFDQISLSGRLASLFTKNCLTQWPHLVSNKFKFKGSVL